MLWILITPSWHLFSYFVERDSRTNLWTMYHHLAKYSASKDKESINSELFLKWVQNFSLHTQHSIDNKVLLLLDDHHNHKQMQTYVLEFVTKNGIALFYSPLRSVSTHQMLTSWSSTNLLLAWNRNMVKTNSRQKCSRNFQIAGPSKNTFLMSGHLYMLYVLFPKRLYLHSTKTFLKTESLPHFILHLS